MMMSNNYFREYVLQTLKENFGERILQIPPSLAIPNCNRIEIDKTLFEIGYDNNSITRNTDYIIENLIYVIKEKGLNNYFFNFSFFIRPDLLQNRPCLVARCQYSSENVPEIVKRYEEKQEALMDPKLS
jgi:hypothetical protein